MKNKILLIENGYLDKLDNNFFVNYDTNTFINKFKDSNIDLSVLQFFVSRNKSTLFNKSKLLKIAITEEFKDKNILSKSLSYLKLILKFLFKIRNFNYAYIFLPGHLNYILVIFCIILNKKYGLYIRGELIRNIFIKKYIIKKANFIITNNPLFYKDLLKVNENTNKIISYKGLGSIIPKISKKVNKDKDINILNILYVGRIEEKKGINELIRLSKILFENKINFKLNLVGYGSLYDSIYKKINNDKDLKSRVRLIGEISNRKKLKKFYNLSDIFIFPSHEEGFPRVLFDAMIYGLPIFTTFVGGIPGYMINEYNCIKINVKDPEYIFSKINENIYSKNKLKILRNNAYKTVNNIFKLNNKTHNEILLKYFKK